jgi:hypothetical protein
MDLEQFTDVLYLILGCFGNFARASALPKTSEKITLYSLSVENELSNTHHLAHGGG